MNKIVLFYITLFLLILALSMTAQNYDFDLWARLIAGMGVVDGGQVLKVDFLSYTPVHTWWDHEWGSGVIFYALLKVFGPYSLIIFQAILIFTIFFIASKAAKLRIDYENNFLFYFFALMAVMLNFNAPIRCHLFSFFFFALFLYILELSRKGENRPLYFVPLLIILWNNIHGGVVSGLGLLGIYIVGEFLNKKPIKKYIITLGLSCASLFINPWGWDYIKFLLMANTMSRPDVSEWWGLFSKFHMFKQIPFKIFMAAILVVETLTLKNNKKFDRTKILALLVTLYLAITHIKLLPFFVITSIVFVHEDFCKLTEHIKLPPWKDKVIYGMILAVSIFTILAKNPLPPVDFKAYPVKEVEFLKINNIKGNLLVNFGLGSYVSYKVYPNNKIFMDGRYEEVYYDFMVPLLKKFFLVTSDASGNWDEILVKFPPDCMIIEKYYPVFEVLKNSGDWALVYEGDVFSVFLPKNKSNDRYKLPSNDIKYYQETLFNTEINFK